MTPNYGEEFQILLQAPVATLLFVRLGLIADSAARFPGNYLRTDPTRLIEARAA